MIFKTVISVNLLRKCLKISLKNQYFDHLGLIEFCITPLKKYVIILFVQI